MAGILAVAKEDEVDTASPVGRVPTEVENVNSTDNPN